MKSRLVKIAAWLKKEWLPLLLLLVICSLNVVDYWAEHNPFPAMPEIITEAEFQEVRDYITWWDANYEYATTWRVDHDHDCDGIFDCRTSVYAYSDNADKEVYTRTAILLPTIWQLISGKCGFAPQDESLVLADEKICLESVISGETKGDRSELRHAVEAMLAEIHEEQAQQAVGTYIPPEKPDFQELIDVMLELQQENETAE